MGRLEAQTVVDLYRGISNSFAQLHSEPSSEKLEATRQIAVELKTAIIEARGDWWRLNPVFAGPITIQGDYETAIAIVDSTIEFLQAIAEVRPDDWQNDEINLLIVRDNSEYYLDKAKNRQFILNHRSRPIR